MMNSDSLTSNHEKIFVTQYTAVLMIILTFVVGAFSRPHQLNSPPAALVKTGTGNLPAIEGPLPPQPASPIGAMSFKNIFKEDANDIDTAQLDGVVAALQAHDIGVRFLITVSIAEGERSAAEAALVARLVSSYRWLETLNIPVGSYQVEGEIRESGDTPELTVEFIGGVGA